MGFEVFILSFESGKPKGFPIDRIRAAFGPHVAPSSASYAWELVYDGRYNGGVNVMPHPTDGTLLHGFTVDRPGADPRMWDALAAILALGPFALVFGGHPPLIGNTDVLQHLPPDMIQSLGQPRFVRNGQEIVREIRSA